MTDWLVNRFIKNNTDINDEHVRLAYGMLSGMTGIFCNIFLFLLKICIGLFIGSIAIISDAFNNLSDCFSCVVTLFGYKLASRPADKEHPFGHGRMEYIASFIVAVIIFLFGFELLKTSVQQIAEPSELHFSIPLLVILACSVLIKVWMSFFNRKLGNRLDNMAMLATAQDSMNDVFTTSATILAMLLSIAFPKIPFDGISGVLVSLLILYGGYGISKEIISRLLGAPASSELTEKIRAMICAHPEVLGVHDMIIHDYGPGRQIGSAHIEVSARMDFLMAHEITDDCEKEISENLHVLMTLHLDPVIMDDPQANACKEEIQNVLKSLSPDLSMHDFRMVKGVEHSNLVFDVLVPFDCKIRHEQIQKAIEDKLATHSEKFYAVVTFDRGFVEHK